MKTGEFEYLEHGKIFRNNAASEFYELAYSTGMRQYSGNLWNALQLIYGTPFSERTGNVSLAFLQVLDESRYAFIQFQSRRENEFGDSRMSRPFFQIRYLLAPPSEWSEHYKQGLSILPSLFHDSNSNRLGLLGDFSAVKGEIGKRIGIPLLDSSLDNSLFARYRLEPNEDARHWVCAVASAVMKFHEKGVVIIRSLESIWEKLILIDAVQHMVQLNSSQLISFAFDSVCVAKVNLRFGENVLGEYPAYILDFSDKSTWKIAEETIFEIFDDLVDKQFIIDNEGRFSFSSHSYQSVKIVPDLSSLLVDGPKLKVFLCHSSSDKGIVRELYKRLESEKWIDPWLDAEKLHPGQNWELEIEKAVENTDAAIVFISEGSVMKEGYVQRELRLVLKVAEEKPEGTIFLIPVRIENCDVPHELRQWHYVDFFPNDGKDAAYKHILSSLLIRRMFKPRRPTEEPEDELPMRYRSMVYLTHSVAPPRIFRDGIERRPIQVMVDSFNRQIFDEIERVVYHLHPTFPNPDREINDRENRFLLKTGAWGEFNLSADIYVKGYRKPLTLYRYINF